MLKHLILPHYCHRCHWGQVMLTVDSCAGGGLHNALEGAFLQIFINI